MKDLEILKKCKCFIYLLVVIFLVSCGKSINKNQKSTISIKNEEIKLSLETSKIKINLGDEFKDYNFLGLSKEKSFAYFSFFDKGKLSYIKVDTKSNKIEKIYDKSFEEPIFSIASEGVFEDNIYFVEMYKENNAEFSMNIVLLDSKGKVLNDEMKGEKINQLQIPYVHLSNDKLLITDLASDPQVENSFVSRLFYYDLTKRNLTLLDSVNYEKKGDKINGEYIMFCGGFDNVVYYQLISYDNSSTLEEGVSHIYKVNYNGENKTRKTIKEFISNEEREVRKVLFLSGDDNVLITSDYILDDKFYDTGNIYLYGKNNEIKSIKIPDITAGNDILNAYKFKNFYLVVSNENYYIYDDLGELKLKENYGFESSKVFNLENSFYYAIKEKDGINIIVNTFK